MKAKIRDIGFSPDSINVGVDFYLELGEFGYGNSFIDVPDYPATELEPKPPTHKVLAPFRSTYQAFPLTATAQEVGDKVKDSLAAFKRANVKVSEAQKYIGLEFKV